MNVSSLYKKNERSVLSSFGLDTLLLILFCFFAFSMKVSNNSCFNSFLVFINALFKISPDLSFSFVIIKNYAAPFLNGIMSEILCCSS